MSRDNQDASTTEPSIMGLANVQLNTKRPLPEQWTLPHEYNMEKREMFDNWKLDVQNQIAYLGDQLNYSLSRYPDREARQLGGPEVPPEFIRKRMLQANQGKMERGVRRS